MVPMFFFCGKISKFWAASSTLITCFRSEFGQNLPFFMSKMEEVKVKHRFKTPLITYIFDFETTQNTIFECAAGYSI